MAFVPADSGSSYADVAEPVDGPLSQLAKAAQQYGIM